MEERLRGRSTTLVVKMNPEFMARCEKLSSELGVDLNIIMNEILKIGAGVIKHRVEDGENEIRIKFQDGGTVKIEGYKNGNSHQFPDPTP